MSSGYPSLRQPTGLSETERQAPCTILNKSKSLLLIEKTENTNICSQKRIAFVEYGTRSQEFSVFLLLIEV